MASKDQQVKQVVQGLALGVLAQDPGEMIADKIATEFAFNHAWRHWPRATEFPSISGHDPGNLIWIGMGRSERRVGATASWTRNRTLEPHVLYEGWTVAECLDVLQDERASAGDWIELGALFLKGVRR